MVSDRRSSIRVGTVVGFAGAAVLALVGYFGALFIDIVAIQLVRGRIGKARGVER